MHVRRFVEGCHCAKAKQGATDHGHELVNYDWLRTLPEVTGTPLERFHRSIQRGTATMIDTETIDEKEGKSKRQSKRKTEK